MEKIEPKSILDRYKRAKEQRNGWESHWQECYDYALPQRDNAIFFGTPGEKKTDKLFDGTAPDAVDQLAASLLAELTPPWARWFGLSPGATFREDLAPALSEELEHSAEILQSHFDRSNFAVEMHQCFLDLVTVGTASLLVEETQEGSPVAFRFTAVPLGQVVLEEGTEGQLDTTFRRSELTLVQLKNRFPKAQLPEDLAKKGKDEPDSKIAVVEAVLPEGQYFQYLAVIDHDAPSANDNLILAEGKFRYSPFINFRWLKTPGEAYGRSPVMKALPDIKTVNKVVELTLKNASISVTGIWQADDDGVLNPATISLVPGTIIPKAVGSAGLTPLDSPGRFDISQIVLDDLRGRIRTAMLADKLAQVNSPRMTATEVLERSAEMARILGATYGRLQSELLTPLVERAISILSRRGEISPLQIDGYMVDLDYKSPLAKQQSQKEAQNIMSWLQAVQALGPEALSIINAPATARWLAKSYGVPTELLNNQTGAGLLGNGLESLVGMASENPEALTGMLNQALPGIAEKLGGVLPVLGSAPSGEAGIPEMLMEAVNGQNR